LLDAAGEEEGDEDESRIVSQAASSRRKSRRVSCTRDTADQRTAHASVVQRSRAAEQPAAKRRRRTNDAGTHRQQRASSSRAASASADAQRAAAATAAFVAPAAPTSASGDASAVAPALPSPTAPVVLPTSAQLGPFERDADAALLKLCDSSGSRYLVPGASLAPVSEAQLLERMRAYNDAMSPHMPIDVCASCGMFALDGAFARRPLAALDALRLSAEVWPLRSLHALSYSCTPSPCQARATHRSHPYRCLFTVYECHDGALDGALDGAAFHLHGSLLVPPAQTVRASAPPPPPPRWR
jgi:hypothetical protein